MLAYYSHALILFYMTADDDIGKAQCDKAFSVSVSSQSGCFYPSGNQGALQIFQMLILQAKTGMLLLKPNGA
jgi:hypothetical protein